MALLFSHVRVSTPDGNEAEFLVSGIPREFEDFDYYTAFEDFLISPSSSVPRSMRNACTRIQILTIRSETL